MPAGRVLGHHAVDLGLGADIDADGRVLQHQQPVALAGPARQHDLLLVAAARAWRCRARARAAATSNFRRIARALAPLLAAGCAGGNPLRRNSPGLRNRFSFTVMVAASASSARLPVAKPSPARDGVGRRAQPDRLAGERDRAASARRDARDRAADRLVAGAAQPGQADDLADADAERDRADMPDREVLAPRAPGRPGLPARRW